jgi:hypothetical protein
MIKEEGMERQELKGYKLYTEFLCLLVFAQGKTVFNIMIL